MTFCSSEWVAQYSDRPGPVYFHALCMLRPDHDGPHSAHMAGDDDVVAAITWSDNEDEDGMERGQPVRRD